MHEFALYGLVPHEEHGRLLQQLAGVTRMQPEPVKELHLVFKAQPPSGLNNTPSGGGSQGVQQQDAQRVKGMLNASLYYVQLVGSVETSTRPMINSKAVDLDSEMANGEPEATTGTSVRWHLEFKDTPDPGKQAVSTRLVSRIPVDDGDLPVFMHQFGYDYVSRYMVTGSTFFDQDTTLCLHRAFQIPSVQKPEFAVDTSFLDKADDLIPLDGSGGYVLQASIEVVDGNNPDLKDRATRQLMAMKETLRQAVTLTPGDRLALDTRLPAINRRN